MLKQLLLIATVIASLEFIKHDKSLRYIKHAGKLCELQNLKLKDSEMRICHSSSYVSIWLP